jgi:hypothetical protein
MSWGGNVTLKNSELLDFASVPAVVKKSDWKNLSPARPAP